MEHSCGSGRFRVKPKIRSQLLCCFIAAQIERPCHEVDHIPLDSAAKAEEIILIQLHARMPVIVERAASHAVSVDFQPVVFGGLLYADCHLDGFIDCHRKPPFIVFRKHETPAVIGRCFAPSTIVMPDFSKNRLIGGQPHFKKQDSFSEDVDFFTFA